jgi:CO/xanthine dehydrogenase Mo-binding subunit
MSAAVQGDRSHPASSGDPSPGAAPLPPSLRGNPRLSRWLRFRADGVVEVRSGKVEIGQGILTALAQIVADELDVAPSRVAMVPANTAESPNEAVTAGSMSVIDSGKALRFACAEARALLVAAAAERLGVPAASLQVRDGDIVASDGRRTSYWAFADAALLDRDATATVVPKGWEGRSAVGESARRVDLPDKVFGRPRFVQDLELPGMLHGRVLRPPSPGARLETLDESGARALPGVIAVVRDGRFVGVIAEREETALRALGKLRAGATWAEAPTLPNAAKLDEWLAAQPVETTPIIEKAGAAGSVSSTKSARFTRPYLAHASIAPSCALARWRGGAVHIWSHTQGVFNQRADIALTFGLPVEKVVIQHVEGAGCYGHNAQDDAALDAALLARAVEERPVKVSWSREDELTWAPFGPAMLVEIAASLDADGEVVDWRGEVWSNGHSTRPGRAQTPVILAASHLASPAPAPLAINTPLETGGGAQRNAVPPYAFPALHIRNHRLLAMPIRTSALRALGAYLNVYAIEALVDEIAAARGEDPVAWRLRHLPDPRARAVVEAVARLAGWSAWTRREGMGRGIGYARYKQNAAYCAVVAEVEAGREIAVRRLSIAVDVGLAVNPDGVANQIEGGAIQAASWTLKEAVRFDRTRITSGSWEDYPILRFSEVPEVRVEIVQRPDEPSVGAGEAPMGPAAAAIGNAVFDALGVRVRDLPITPDRIVAAMG